MVTHPSTNRAKHTVTSFMWRMMLLRCQTINTLRDKYVPEEDVVETVKVQLPRGSSPQQCTVISAQLFRPCADTSTCRRASSICRVPLGDVSDSSTLPRCDALRVTRTCTCSRECTAVLVLPAQPSVFITKSADESGPKLLVQTHRSVQQMINSAARGQQTKLRWNLACECKPLEYSSTPNVALISIRNGYRSNSKLKIGPQIVVFLPPDGGTTQ